MESDDRANLQRTARKKRKIVPTGISTTLPKQLETSIPESELFTKLLEFERSIDATVLRKRYELEESLRGPARFTSTLRLWVCSHNPASEAQPSLRIIGKLVDQSGRVLESKRKFTSFVSKICIHLVTAGAGDRMIEWQRPETAATDGIEISMPAGQTGEASQVQEARICLTMDYCPARFKASQQLCEVLGIGPCVETRPRLLENLWHYIKVHQLQENEPRTKINNDQKLKALFGCDSIDISSLLRRLDEHLSPPDPIEISIRLGDDDQCYDIQVEQPMQELEGADNFIAQRNVQLQEQITGVDRKMAEVLQNIKDHRHRRQFLLCLHHAPIDFLNDLIASQVRDQQTLACEDHRASDDMQTARFVKDGVQGTLNEAVQRYLGVKATTPYTNH